MRGTWTPGLVAEPFAGAPEQSVRGVLDAVIATYLILVASLILFGNVLGQVKQGM